MKLRKKSIVVFEATIVVVLLIGFCVPQVIGDLPGPYFIMGYVNFKNGETVPEGTIVTLTNERNSNVITTTTSTEGSYQVDVGKDSGMDCEDGDKIIVNCSCNGKTGKNTACIDIAETFSWCNLSLRKKSLDLSLSNLATSKQSSSIPSGQSVILDDISTVSGSVWGRSSPFSPVVGPLSDAKVELCGTDYYYTFTDTNGEFVIIEVKYDVYTVKINKDGYKNYEDTVEIEEPTVNLEPIILGGKRVFVSNFLQSICRFSHRVFLQS